MTPPFRRIVHVMRRFVPAKWGGTESVVFHLAREFERQGIESPIYATAMFASPGVETFRGVQVHRFPYTLPWLGLSPEARHALELKGGSPLSFAMLRALLADRHANFLHSHVQHRLGGTVRFAARRHHIPYAVSIHGGHHTLPGEQTEQMLAPTRGKFEWGRAAGLLLGARRTLDDASAIFCVGQDECEAMQRSRSTQNVQYQPNGVDLTRFENATPDAFLDRYPVLRGKPFLLCVSRVDPQKNQLLLIDAFARIADQLPDHHLVLIGPCVVESYAKQVLERAAPLGDRFLLIPGLPPDEDLLPSAFRAAETFVLPSMHEPFGIVILEAWAARCPVIAARVGGIPGFTRDGENILLFPSGDAEALSRHLLTLAADAGRRNALATAGHDEAARDYDWPVIARRMLSNYQNHRP